MIGDYEKLGAFYLGRPYDLEAGRPREGVVLYDARDLVTHAVIVGMTGSGKTGLGIGLLEEAAIDGIPAIVIDPKGDLSNLLLTFPKLRPVDFRPWIDEAQARERGDTADAYAAHVAAAWRKGLAEWGQDGGRIERLRRAAEFTVFTPGSSAGVPVSIVRSFAAPPQSIFDDAEALRDRIRTTASSLLGLAGIDADPVRSREATLLAAILETGWRAGRDLDLADLIEQIQKPPLRRVGVVDLETFFPARARFELAMAINNLLASPGFAAWLDGEPLDVDAMLHTAEGKPRVSIFSIAHLGDAERMFFVALLLDAVLQWMRAQPGTSTLRAIVYMDEIFGYFPPVANPPSKPPLLALLKQARAFGVGVVLATQNPVDLDYKGLANTGTWFIGRLQTERDKARLLDGLEGAAGGIDRGAIGDLLSRLGKRVFLMNNVHDDAPVVFETRWTLSYLRGPLERGEIRRLGGGRDGATFAAGVPAPGAARAAPIAEPGGKRLSTARPVLSPGVRQYFLQVRGGGDIVYHPMVLGIASIRFADAKARVDVTRDTTRLAPITADAIPVDWGAAGEIGLGACDLLAEPDFEGEYAELPPAASEPRRYQEWGRALAVSLQTSASLELCRSPSLGELSRPGESERDFRLRLDLRGREERDRQTEELRAAYSPKLAALRERLRRAAAAVERESEQAREQKLQTSISIGATLIDALLGRKIVKASTLGRASTAARGVGRQLKEAGDVARARETVEAVRQQIEDLDGRLRAEIEALEARIDPRVEALERVVIRPKKSHITVRLVALAWAPYRRAADAAPSDAARWRAAAPAWE